MSRNLRLSGIAVSLILASYRPVAGVVLQVTNLPAGKFLSLPSISRDGRLIAVGSNGNLGGLNPTPIGNAFVYDVLTNQFTRITADGASDPVISADGRFVAFSASADYTGRNEDGSDEIFRFDRTRKRFQQLTKDKEGDGSSYLPAISGDGKRIVFETSSNLRRRNPDFSNEVFLFNRSGNMALSNDPEGDGESHTPAISGDGKLIAFVTTSNLTGRNEDFSQELMIYDLANRDLSQVTNDPEGNGESSQPAVSGNGRFVTFVSSSNLGGANPDNYSAVWLRTKSGYSTLVTNTPLGPFDGDMPAIDDDAKWIAFVAGYDITGANPDFSSEILLFNRQRKTFIQLTDSPRTCFNFYPKLSGNGARIAYYSNCDVVGSNADHGYEIFLVDNPALNLVVHAEGPVSLTLTDPQGAAINAASSTIANATYESGDFDGDSVPEVRITVPQALEGRYVIRPLVAPGAQPDEVASIDGTLNDTNVLLASDTVAALSGADVSFSNQGFARRSSRLVPLSGIGSKLYLGARMPHGRASSGPVVVRFNAGGPEQVFDFGPLENFGAYGTFKGIVDGFATKLRVINRRDGSTSISLSAKGGDLTEFAGDDNLNMTISVRVGNDTDMYNWRFKRNLLTGQLVLK